MQALLFSYRYLLGGAYPVHESCIAESMGLSLRRRENLHLGEMHSVGMNPPCHSILTWGQLGRRLHEAPGENSSPPDEDARRLAGDLPSAAIR
jgi:hypothetical protein